MADGAAAESAPDILPDVLAPHLRAVFCGSAAGTRSAAERAYYAHPQNRFWPTLHRAGFTPRRLAPAEYPLVLRYGLGLTDICKTAFGPDKTLPRHTWDADGLARKVELWRPGVLAFVGKAPAAVFLGTRFVPYGLLDDLLGATRLFVLPSPSGLASRFWDEGWWRALAALLPPTPV